MATVHLAIDDPGLGVLLAEALQAQALQVSWHGAAIGSENVPDVVVLDADPNGDVARIVEVWRRYDPPPAIALLGSTPAARRAGERLKLPFVPKPVDPKLFVATAQSAIKLRFVTAYTPLAALAAVGMRPRDDDLENASVIVGGARMIDPILVRAALRPHALAYVTPLALLQTLRDERALNVPEQNLAMRLDGASTLKSVIDSGLLEAAAAARLLWALACVRAIAFLPEPHPEGKGPRLRATIRARRNLKARRARCENALFHDVLEVSFDPEPEEVETACRHLAGWYSPKRMKGLDLGDLAPLVEPLWQQILKARATLLPIDSRIAYERWLAQHGVTLAERRDAWDRHTMDAEDAFAAGQKALGAGEIPKAVSSLAKASRLKPEEPDYECYAAWARVLSEEARGSDRATIAARERTRAEEALAGRKPRPRALVAIGLLCEAAGDLVSAREAFEDALDCEPRLPLARRALQRLGVTVPPEPPRG